MYAGTQGDVGSYTLVDNLSVSGLTFSNNLYVKAGRRLIAANQKL